MPRTISWVKAALKDFQAFPEAVRDQMTTALRLAAHGEKAEKAKPMKGLGSGIYEMALAYRGNAYRVVYAVHVGEDIWVIHAFQKKSKTGIKTPKPEIDLTRDRIKRLKEILR
jgi:phage-related protein